MMTFVYVLIGWTVFLIGLAGCGVSYFGFVAAKDREWPLAAFSAVVAVTIWLLGAGVVVAVWV